MEIVESALPDLVREIVNATINDIICRSSDGPNCPPILTTLPLSLLSATLDIDGPDNRTPVS